MTITFVLDERGNRVAAVVPVPVAVAEHVVWLRAEVEAVEVEPSGA